MKIKQPESGHYTFWKCYIQGGPRTKQWHCFFRGAPKILKINPFDRYILGKCWQMKIKQPQSGHYTFWKCYIQDAPRKKQYHCFFRGAPKISRKSDFYTNQNKETKIKTLLYLWKCYIQVVPWTMQYRCFFQGVPTNFKKKRLIYMHFRWIVANQNNKLEVGRYTFWKCYRPEVLYRYEGRDITTFLQNIQNVKNMWHFYWEFGQIPTD